MGAAVNWLLFSLPKLQRVPRPRGHLTSVLGIPEITALDEVRSTWKYPGTSHVMFTSYADHAAQSSGH